MPGLTSLANLEGKWACARRIVHSDGTENTYEGTTVFARSGPRLIQSEDGYLTTDPARPALRATRTFVWRLEGDRLECAFDDNRPFHTVPLHVTRPETTYLCPPDRYHVAYDFSDLRNWQAVWRVEGPKKAYVMTSTYTPLPRSEARLPPARHAAINVSNESASSEGE